MNKEKPFLDESLYSACQNNNINLVKELLQNSRIDINKQHKDGNTPLIIACRKNNL